MTLPHAPNDPWLGQEDWLPQHGAHITDPVERDLFVELVELWTRVSRAKAASRHNVRVHAWLEKMLADLDGALFELANPSTR